MEFNNDFIRRLEDLSSRCARSCSVTATAFLTPAERLQAESWAKRGNTEDTALVFHGGHTECERVIAFFLPYYLDAESFSPEDTIRAIHFTAHFGTPGHRDYLGALLGMGIERDRLGDIWVEGTEAVVFCHATVAQHLLGMEKAGRVTVKPELVPLGEVIAPVKQVKPVSFTVMSPRLDAVVSGMFNISRTEAAKAITLGNVNVNYFPSEKTDRTVVPGDIISLRGHGKGTVKEFGGTSRKGRTFIQADIYK